MSSVVEIKNLSKTYDKGLTLAFENISFSLEKGKIYALMGKSGCGKSTLLNIIGTLDNPTSGEVFYDGKSLKNISDIYSFRRNYIGIVFQFHNLLPVLTLKENVQTALMYNNSYKEKKEEVMELLDDMGLKTKANSLANSVSGGEKQRVAIARALINKPKLILADEPTGNVDSVTTKMILKKLTLYNQINNSTMLIATHDEEIAKEADVIIKMKDGKIVHERSN